MRKIAALLALACSMLLPTVASANCTKDTNNSYTVTCDTYAIGYVKPVAASFTTPSGTTAYASGNLIANSAIAGSVVPLDFAGACRYPGGTGIIRRARWKTADTGFAGASVVLYLYKNAPTVANGDHGTWLSTESEFIGSIPITMDKHFSDAEKGIGAPAAGSEISFDCATNSSDIYGLAVAAGAITPQGAKLHTIVLEDWQN